MAGGRQPVAANASICACEPRHARELRAARDGGGACRWRDAYASHESSLQMWELPLPAAAQLEITTILERRPRVRGVRCHRSGLLIECDVTVLRGIPLSTPERSIVDVSSRFDVRILGRMVDEALRRRLTTIVRLQRAVDRLAPAL